MEESIYHISDSISYKPDFLLYDNNNLKIVYEIKDGKYDVNHFEKIKYFFNNQGIYFKVLNRSKKIAKQNPHILDEFNEWKITSKHCVSGKNNPHYGFKHSEKTKQLISSKAKARLANQTEKLSTQSKLAYIKHKETYKKAVINRSKKYWDKKNTDDPLILCNCVTCGKQFQKRTSAKRVTCKNSWCTMRYKESLGWSRNEANNLKNNFKQRLIIQSLKVLKNINDLPNINYDCFANEAKRLKSIKEIPEKMSMNLKIIEKYFQNFNNFIHNLREYEN